MDKDYKKLLSGVFGIQKEEPIQPFVPMIETKKYETRNSIERVVSPESTAQTQALIWGNGNLPPVKPPNQKMTDQGTSATMNNPERWKKL